MVVSPGWEPAQPGLQNSLLAFFGVHADSDMAVKAQSTHVSPHPITGGIDQAMAKDAVHLEAPPEASLISAGKRTVLVALPYRQGRVVVASFGQWFHPEPGRPDWKLRRFNSHWTRDVPPGKRPVESGKRVEMNLLRSVLRWLRQPLDDEPLQTIRDRFAAAHRVGLDVQFQIQPQEKLYEAMDRLVDQMPSGTWKEEALWAAGESILQMFYFAVTPMEHPPYGWPIGRPMKPDARYFQQLVDQFPDSPLRTLAEWRFTDCRRRAIMYAAYHHNGQRMPPADSTKLIADFQRIDAPSASLPWIWRELRVAETYFQMENYARAAEHYEAICENAEEGAEKTLALMNLTFCFDQLKKPTEAARYSARAEQSPEIFWWSSSRYAGWAPLKPSLKLAIGTTKRLLKTRK